MRAFRLSQSGRPSAYIQNGVLRPAPGRGELLISVCASGFMATELSGYLTSHTKTGAARIGAVPGHEFSGVVASVGAEVGCLEVGHEVFGMNDWYTDGAMADYCIAPYFAVVPKPANLTHIDAASVPIGALTAWQGLFDHGRLQHGNHVLIHGGAGAVGVFAIQLARLRGAITGFLVSGQLRPVVDAVIPLSQVPEAYAGKVPSQGRGKLVIAVGDAN